MLMMVRQTRVIFAVSQTEALVASTVISLGDWYHNASPSLFPNPTKTDP